MPIAEEFLERLRTHTDLRAGYAEEFLHPTLGGAGTVAVLSRPLGPSRPVAFVLCHSLGQEFVHLSRFDTTIARTMSVAGFPVLRYHGQGYGDSERGASDISLTSHLTDATDAVALLSGQEGIETVGTMGARFGGLVAAVVAARERLPFVATWEPVTKGAQYMRNFVWTRLFAEWAGTVEGAGVDELLETLETTGQADIKGFLLTKRAYDEISAIDLSRELSRFAGTALVVAIARGENPGPGLVRLAEGFRALGATCDLEVLQDDLAAEFGNFHFKTSEMAKVDTQFELNQAIADLTASWALRHVDATFAAGEDGRA